MVFKVRKETSVITPLIVGIVMYSVINTVVMQASQFLPLPHPFPRMMVYATITLLLTLFMQTQKC